MTHFTPVLQTHLIVKVENYFNDGKDDIDFSHNDFIINETSIDSFICTLS